MPRGVQHSLEQALDSLRTLSAWKLLGLTNFHVYCYGCPRARITDISLIRRFGV